MIDQTGHGMSDEAWMYCRKMAVMSPEIVEIGEDSKSFNAAANNNNISVCCEDVYVGVGKDELDLVKWVLEQYGSASFRVFLVHVFPPVVQVPTPVGMLLRSQMAPDQVRFYSNQENNKRRALLQKYIRLCQDAKRSIGKGEYVKKNAPEYCEVTTVFKGKNGQQDRTDLPISQARKWPQLERNFLECVCFSGKLD
ncbi:hypothetical protein QQ045_023059 [Rhodiola kirilowii]